MSRETVDRVMDPAAKVLADPTAYADDERLHAALTELRANNPVAWVDNRPYRPFWAITKHADIMAIERDNARFTSEWYRVGCRSGAGPVWYLINAIADMLRRRPTGLCYSCALIAHTGRKVEVLYGPGVYVEVEPFAHRRSRIGHVLKYTSDIAAIDSNGDHGWVRWHFN